MTKKATDAVSSSFSPHVKLAIILLITVLIGMWLYSKDLHKYKPVIIDLGEYCYVYTKFECSFRDCLSIILTEVSKFNNSILDKDTSECRVLYGIDEFNIYGASSQRVLLTVGLLTVDKTVAKDFHKLNKNYNLADNFKIKLLGTRNLSSDLTFKFMQDYNTEILVQKNATFVNPIFASSFSLSSQDRCTGLVHETSKEYFKNLPGTSNLCSETTK